MRPTKVPTFIPTKNQREWLETEKERNGNSYATIIRLLIQEKIEASQKENQVAKAG